MGTKQITSLAMMAAGGYLAYRVLFGGKASAIAIPEEEWAPGSEWTPVEHDTNIAIGDTFYMTTATGYLVVTDLFRENGEVMAKIVRTKMTVALGYPDIKTATLTLLDLVEGIRAGELVYVTSYANGAVTA